MSVSAPDVRRTVLPPDDLEQMLELSRFLEQHSEPALLLGPDGEKVPLPMEVYETLVEVARAMSKRQAITVAPLSQRLTTQEAADMLGISRPTLVKLLEAHEIPFDRPGAGRHRKLRLEDVLTYQDRRRSDRRARLAEMTRQAVDDGLYEFGSDDYEAALREARHGENG